jgi:hypothetical protein
MPVLASYDIECDNCYRHLSQERGFARHLDGGNLPDLRIFAQSKWWRVGRAGRAGRWLCDACRPDFCRTPLSVDKGGPLICHLRPRHKEPHGYLPLQNRAYRRKTS